MTRRPAAVALAAALAAALAVAGAADATPRHRGAGAPHRGAKAPHRVAHVRARRDAHAPERWKAIPFTLAAVPGAGTPAPGPSPVPTPVATPVPSVTPVPTPRPPALPGSDPRSVSVGSTEFSFTLSQPSVLAGDVRVQFDNSRAQDPHELDIRVKGGADVFAFGRLQKGEVASKTVTLPAGTYVVYCPLPEHESLGMRAQLTVSG